MDLNKDGATAGNGIQGLVPHDLESQGSMSCYQLANGRSHKAYLGKVCRVMLATAEPDTITSPLCSIDLVHYSLAII